MSDSLEVKEMLMVKWDPVKKFYCLFEYVNNFKQIYDIIVGKPGSKEVSDKNNQAINSYVEKSQLLYEALSSCFDVVTKAADAAFICSLGTTDKPSTFSLLVQPDRDSGMVDFIIYNLKDLNNRSVSKAIMLAKAPAYVLSNKTYINGILLNKFLSPLSGISIKDYKEIPLNNSKIAFGSYEDLSDMFILN